MKQQLGLDSEIKRSCFPAQVIDRFVFVNVTKGISDRSVFTVPASCNSAVIGPKVIQ